VGSTAMSAPVGDLVLVIDDDEAMRKSTVGLLHGRGFKALAADSVGEGLRLFSERRPAAVLLDLKLPDGTGIDVLRELQRQAPGTPVVVVSGYGRVGEAVEAMRMGAADFIEKPLARERLFEVLGRVLRPRLPGGRRTSRASPTVPASAWRGDRTPCAASTSSSRWRRRPSAGC
jgi:FixJ family two-component response regulator